MGKYRGEFQIEEVTKGDAVSYRVCQKDGEKLEFTVYPAGDEYTSEGFADTCPVAFVLKKAGELGLVLEPGDRENELIITVDGFEEIGELTKKLVQISNAYRQAGLPSDFTKGTVGDGWSSADIRVEIREFAPAHYRPGFVQIPDCIVDCHFQKTTQKYLENNYLTYLNRYYLGEIPKDVPEDALKEVNKDCEGITIAYGDRTVEYPKLDKDSLYFAEVYRLALQEGWEPVAEENAFTITAGERSCRFELVFEEKETVQRKRQYLTSWDTSGYDDNKRPVVYWYEPETGERKPAALSPDQDKACISAEILEEITGADLKRGLKLKEAKEQRQEMQGAIGRYLNGADVMQPGDTAEIANWRVTLKQVEGKNQIDYENDNIYHEARKGMILVSLKMDVENKGTMEKRFIESFAGPDDLRVSLLSFGGESYMPASLLGKISLADACIEPKAVFSNQLVFEIPEHVWNEEQILLVMERRDERQIFLIK